MNKNKQKACQDIDCDKLFIPYRTTDKYCSYACAKKNQKPKEKAPKKIRLAKFSNRRNQENKDYLRKRVNFLNRPENKRCRVFPNSRATEIHHMKGRIGDLLLVEKYWLPVSRRGHEKIESNPIWAKEKGFSLPRT